VGRPRNSGTREAFIQAVAGGNNKANGTVPTEGTNALDGACKFLATEHLYTNGPPTGLAADLISFLTSSPEVAQLRDTSFIGCADLAGTALSADCTDN
jgi:hypothetical protein